MRFLKSVFLSGALAIGAANGAVADSYKIAFAGMPHGDAHHANIPVHVGRIGEDGISIEKTYNCESEVVYGSGGFFWSEDGSILYYGPLMDSRKGCGAGVSKTRCYFVVDTKHGRTSVTRLPLKLVDNLPDGRLVFRKLVKEGEYFAGNPGQSTDEMERIEWKNIEIADSRGCETVSHDRRKTAYLGKYMDIYIHEDGSGERRIRIENSYECPAEWLPDNRTLLYFAREEGESTGLYSLDTETGATRKLLGSGMIYENHNPSVFHGP